MKPLSDTYVEETRIGFWFLRSHTWQHHVLRVAINDLRSLFSEALPAAPVILDAGCGQGKSFQYLYKTFTPQRLIGLDASTGDQRWTYDSTPGVLTLRGTGAPVVTNHLAVAGLSTGKVVALDTRNGVPVWEQRVAIPQGRSELERIVDIDGGLLLSGGTLYVASYQGRMAALELESGRVLWQRDASSYAGVAQGFGSVYVSLASGTVEGVDERSTTALWSNDSLARRQLSAPEVFSSYVAVGDMEGYLHLLSQVDGRFVGRTRIDSDGLRARPLVVGDMIYVFGNSGKLEALTIR